MRKGSKGCFVKNGAALVHGIQPAKQGDGKNINKKINNINFIIDIIYIMVYSVHIRKVMAMIYATPTRCAVCGEMLQVSKVTCPNCAAEITGTFAPCKYCALNEKQKMFLESFLMARGNIKEVERTLELSYPTVKGLLDELLATLFPPQEEVAEIQLTAAQVLDELAQRKITAQQAAELLEKIKT